MAKLTHYVEIAATEYFTETGKIKLDLQWIAEFFQHSGIQDDYPQHDIVAFYAMVQKVLTKKAEMSDEQSS